MLLGVREVNARIGDVMVACCDVCVCVCVVSMVYLVFVLSPVAKEIILSHMITFLNDKVSLHK